MTETEALGLMKSPGQHRAGIWRGGVLQIKVTTACDLDCKGCTAGVALAKRHRRVWSMSPEQFRTALRSLQGYQGVIGMFGGNPALHPQFAELCTIFREEIPDQDQRGLWCNNLFGKGAICRETFSPIHSNLNVHRSQAAYDEIRRDWPEVRVLEHGLTSPSKHASPWVDYKAVQPDESARWDTISRCFVNQTWSAEITLVRGELRAFFCEVAATMAEYADLEDGVPTDLGAVVEPGWWSRPIDAFAHQVRQFCHSCSMSANPKKITDFGTDEPEEYAGVHAPVFVTIKGRRASKEIGSLAEIAGGDPATKYLPRGVMRVI